MQLAAAWSMQLIQCKVAAENFEASLGPLLNPGDFLLNLAPSVSSRDLIGLTQRIGALYLDTGIEPWEYAPSDSDVDTSNAALRNTILSAKQHASGSSTAVVAHGANPGFVSVLVKRALIAMASVSACARWDGVTPTSRLEWATLASALDIRVIQISEYDTQRSAEAPRQGDFVNTWSVPGFVEECLQDAELGWGTHEHTLPSFVRQRNHPPGASIQLARAGCETHVKSWSPLQGEFDAYLLSHNESISIADYLTLGEPSSATYRPTVYYAYRPIDAALASLAALRAHDGAVVMRERVLKDELHDGADELGVLLMSGTGQSLWLGSALTLQRARSLAAHNNATSLQVVSSVLAAMQWACAHPERGIVESEELDYDELFQFARHYWEPIREASTQWAPAGSAGELQFSAFLIE